MSDGTDAAAELETALARRVHLLAAALIGGSCLLYLGWVAWRPATPGARAIATVALLSIGCVLVALAWARRTRRYGLATAGLCWLVFAAVSGLMVLQGGIAGTAVWWLPLGPLLTLQGGAVRSGMAMAGAMLAELVALQVLRGAAWMPTPIVVNDVQRFIAVTSASASMLVTVGLGLHWRRRLLEELQTALATAHRASTVKSRFLANMSHEIRTPLNGIVGATELLRATRLDDGQRQVLGVLRRSSAALLALVNDVLDLSKLEAGRMRTEHVAFDLHDAIHDAAEVFSAQAEAKGVELLAHCTADLPRHMVGDPARLRQILHNLVANAVKFTGEGEVRVFAAPETAPGGQRWVRIAVRDTGIGLTEAQRETLFEAFEQGDVSTTRRFGGSGLGLAISRELAGLLGGRIEVESVPGQGSTFMLLLPLVAVDAAPEPDVGRPLAGVEVEVLSPTRSLREDVVEVLERAGAHCEAHASVDAVTSPGGSAPHVVLCDEAALRRAGLDAAAWLDRLARDGKRGVLLVGLAVRARSLPRGLVPLYKPAPPGRVVDAVQRALGPVPSDSARMELDDRDDDAPLQRVLVVEDNPVNQLVAQGLLARLGAEAVVAADGEQALRLLVDPPAGERFDLVLMDCQMPTLDGLACTRRLRALEAAEGRVRTPVVAMTAQAESEAGAACRAAGMDDFVSKPVELDALARVLDRWGGARG